MLKQVAVVSSFFRPIKSLNDSAHTPLFGNKTRELTLFPWRANPL